MHMISITTYHLLPSHVGKLYNDVFWLIMNLEIFWIACEYIRELVNGGDTNLYILKDQSFFASDIRRHIELLCCLKNHRR